MPMAVAQAVPSEVQSTVGSEWNWSPATRGRVVWPQLTPPSIEKNWAWPPPPAMLLEAAMTSCVLKGLMRTSDSLRASPGWAPERRTLGPVDTADRMDGGGGGGTRRCWWLTIQVCTF